LWNNLAAVARVHVLIAAVLFGTTGTAQALGPEIEPLAVGTARIAVGAALLVLVALASGRFRLGGADRRLILFSGACVAAYQATFFAAVDDTGVAVGTVVAIGSAPVFTGLLARSFAGERLTRRWAAATALGCAGVCTLVLGEGQRGGLASTDALEAACEEDVGGRRRQGTEVQGQRQPLAAP
jgi:drug/metabolite transporter, DME family